MKYDGEMDKQKDKEETHNYQPALKVPQQKSGNMLRANENKFYLFLLNKTLGLPADFHKKPTKLSTTATDHQYTFVLYTHHKIN